MVALDWVTPASLARPAGRPAASAAQRELFVLRDAFGNQRPAAGLFEPLLTVRAGQPVDPAGPAGPPPPPLGRL